MLCVWGRNCLICRVFMFVRNPIGENQKADRYKNGAYRIGKIKIKNPNNKETKDATN